MAKCKYNRCNLLCNYSNSDLLCVKITRFIIFKHEEIIFSCKTSHGISLMFVKQKILFQYIITALYVLFAHPHAEILS